MRIATFNVNGIGARLPHLLKWLEKAAPDVVCLQELKAHEQILPLKAVRDAGYGALWKGQRLWNGVAILAKGAEPVPIRRELPGDPEDEQARYLEVAVNGVIVCCLYAPNGNPQPGPKFDYKLAWLDRLLAHAQALWKSGHPVAMAGDFNVVPTDFDIYNPRSWKKDALLQPAPRERYAKLLAQGWTDALRARFPKEPVFTFWDYFRQHWERNAGLRIDHLLLSKDLAPRMVDAGVDRWVRAEQKASDHAPTWVELDMRNRARKAKKRT